MEALEVYSQRVLEFIDGALAKKRLPNEKVKVLFSAFAQRVQEGDFRQSCAAGTVSLDLEKDLEEIRIVLAVAFREWIALIEGHFDFGDTRRTKSFAGLLLTNIEGAYIRCRAERSSQPFTEAGAWLAELAERRV